MTNNTETELDLTIEKPKTIVALLSQHPWHRLGGLVHEVYEDGTANLNRLQPKPPARSSSRTCAEACAWLKASHLPGALQMALSLEEVHGFDSIEVALICNNLGVVCKYTSKFDEAERFYHRALDHQQSSDRSTSKLPRSITISGDWNMRVAALLPENRWHDDPSRFGKSCLAWTMSKWPRTWPPLRPCWMGRASSMNPRRSTIMRWSSSSESTARGTTRSRSTSITLPPCGSFAETWN